MIFSQILKSLNQPKQFLFKIVTKTQSFDLAPNNFESILWSLKDAKLEENEDSIKITHKTDQDIILKKLPNYDFSRIRKKQDTKEYPYVFVTISYDEIIIIKSDEALELS